jgi:2,3-bisphosphoglycerate-dependent phosphoglycerate mutase
MELYFIRHGQSENNANWGREDYQESSDPELTEIGRNQVKYLAQFLAEKQVRDEDVRWNNQNRHGFGLTHLYTSLMVRAVDTGTAIAEATGLPIIAWPEIHETGGIFSRISEDEMAGLPGKKRTYFDQYYPNLVLPDWLDENGWWNRPFEDRDARRPRAERVLKELLARHGDRPGQPEHRVAIISHGGFFMYLLTATLNIEMRRIDELKHEFWFTMNNCGITHLDFKDGQVQVAYTNRTDFLPDHLVT